VEVAQAAGNPDPALVHAMVSMRPGPEGGSVSILRLDGTEVPGSPVSGHGLAVRWAIAVEGNDHIWVSHLSWTPAAIVELCGYPTETWPPGMKMGAAISPPGGYVGGLQMQWTSPSIRPETCGSATTGMIGRRFSDALRNRAPRLVVARLWSCSMAWPSQSVHR
jgi:hypothetical protein